MKPTIGRIVHYLLREGRSAGELRPAIIVRVWPDGHGAENTVQLRVFLDGSNDAGAESDWATSVHEGTEPGTWQWPARS